ncbi:Gfo/Idh/MocA family oxidoreductase [bacterium]|nr:Gfo/Idh/MocA family oxidoreductase [bacterium]
MPKAPLELGVGIIGYGFMGKVHTYAYRSLPYLYDPPAAKATLAVVCTRHADTARAAAEHGGFAQGVTDYRAVIDDPAVDVVHVCTPNDSHRDICVAALQAGKHVYCDKPLARTAAEAEDIVAAAEAAPDLRHQVTFQNRFIPAVLRARELMEDGFCGDLFGFRAAFLHSGYIDANRAYSWRLDEAVSGGGALLDLGSHAIDMIRMLCGDFTRVLASAKTFCTERKDAAGVAYPVHVDDVVLMQAELANGAVGTIEASRVATGTNDDLRLEIHGSQGAMHYSLMDANWLYVYDLRDPAGPYGGSRGYKAIECTSRFPAPATLLPPKVSVGWNRGHIASLHNFLTAIAEGRRASPDFHDGLAVQRIMDATYASARAGAWREIPHERRQP